MTRLHRCRSSCRRSRPRRALGKTAKMTWRSCLASSIRGRVELCSKVPLHHSVVVSLLEMRRGVFVWRQGLWTSLDARGRNASSRTEMTCVAGTGLQSRQPKLPISTKILSVSTSHHFLPSRPTQPVSSLFPSHPRIIEPHPPLRSATRSHTAPLSPPSNQHCPSLAPHFPPYRLLSRPRHTAAGRHSPSTSLSLRALLMTPTPPPESSCFGKHCLGACTEYVL